MGEAERWLRSLKGSTLGLSVTAIAGILIGAAATTDAVDKLLIWGGLKPNALELAQDDARGRFSRDITRAAWRRLFLMRRLLLAFRSDFLEDEKDEIWRSYLKSLEEWNSDLMVNILSLQRYYGTEKRDQFERQIQGQFGRIHNCLESLRHPEGKVACRISPTRDLNSIAAAIDRLNASLYLFVSGLPDKTGAGKRNDEVAVRRLGKPP